MYLSIFGALLLVIVFVFLFVVSIVVAILRTVFGVGKSIFSSSKQSGSKTQTRYQSDTSSQSGNHKKVFDKDEGEYVDFEEVD